jgi:IgA Peptidase M64
MADLVMFPHADLHIALHGVGGGGTPDLTIFVFERKPRPAGDPDPSLILAPVTGLCTIDFLAPFNAVGHRFDNLPVFDPSINRITATTPGVYLFELRFGDQSLVGRLQVHDRINAWWFGNQSITTAVHPTLAFSQPSIYASFSTDAGTDPVGDITGCEYVTLTSDDSSRVEVFDVFNQARLRGVSAGETTMRGTFMGTTRSLKVYVENYDALHPHMEEVHVPHVADAEFRTNMLFLAEGFQTTDRPRFDQAVTQIVDEMFTKPRHEPYPLLKESINVWKAFPSSPASRESHPTCGFLVADSPGSVVQGKPIPEWRFHKAGMYSLAGLVDHVGLPRSDESRNLAALTALWNTQGLKNFDATKVDNDLIRDWKALKPKSILQAQDTYLGFMLGRRLGDRPWENTPGFQPRGGSPPLFIDDNSPLFREFLDRLYHFYRGINTTFLGFDPRRTPPEWPRSLFWSYMRNLGTLKPHPNIGDIGQWWLADPPGGVSKSTGLLCILMNDYMFVRGINNFRWIAFDLQERGEIDYDYSPVQDTPIMQRRPVVFPPITAPITDTLAHEFGHSFGPGDEYEGNDGDEWNFKKNEDFLYDNLTRLGWIFANGVVNAQTKEVTYADRKINPAKVKWFALERMQLSDALLEPAKTVPGGVRLTIDRCHIGQWLKAKEANSDVFLRETGLNHEQLPLPTGAGHFLAGLKIVSVDAAAGTLVVTGPGLPPIASPVFQRDAVLFVPLRGPAPGNKPLTIVEPEVLDFLATNGTPLNANPDNVHSNGGDDNPVAIPHLQPPLQDFKLIGVYEGSATWAGATYRPAGACKMRHHFAAGDHAQFCHVCKWLIVNRVNPTLHALLDAKLYPRSTHIP